MNSTIHVNIAGVAFMLETEGYRLLKDYLVLIEVGYKGNPDGAEILSDIEARISELILNKQGTDIVVPTQDIQSIINQLGLPDGLDPNATSDPIPSADDSPNTTTRRLYRNPDGAKLGGVCSGLSVYFHVDASLIRLLFCSPLLILICICAIPFVNELCGFFATMIAVSVILYILLWLALPKARTPRQRLEMTGEKITASSIHRNISEDLNDVKPSQRNDQSASVFSELLYLIGRILLFCVKACLLFIGAILTLIAIGVTIAFFVILIGGHMTGFPLLNLLGIPFGLLCIFGLLLIVLPIGIIIYLLMQMVFKFPRRHKTLSILFGIWILILIYSGVYIIDNAAKFRQMNLIELVQQVFPNSIITSTSTIQTPLIVHDTVRVETISVGDSTVTDTVRIEYFTE